MDMDMGTGMGTGMGIIKLNPLKHTILLVNAIGLYL